MKQPAGSEDACAKPRRILLVAARDPLPARRGDQLRAQQFCSALSAAHRVDLLAPREAGGSGTGLSWSGERLVYRRTVSDRLRGLLRSWMTGRPVQSGLYESAELERQLLSRSAEYDAVVVQMVRLGRAAACVPADRLFVDLIDALSLNFARRAVLQRGFSVAGRGLLRREARRLEQAERALIARAANSSVVCERDRRLLALAREPLSQEARPASGRAEPASSVGAVNLETVPLPISRSEAHSPSGNGPTADIVFTGNLGYWVNRDALGWFCSEVWPRLLAQRPQLRMMVAGDRPAPSLLRRLRGCGITVYRAPCDLRRLIRGATVAVAPMRGGAGVPVKVLEAFAEGVPVVASPWAAAGIEPAGGTKSELPLMVAEHPEEWVARVLQVLEDPGKAERLAAEARQFVRREHGEEHCARRAEAAVAACWGRKRPS